MKQQAGFTLLELMVTVAIVAIIASFAVPSMSSMLERNKLRSETQRISSMLNLARSTAITENQAIVLSFDDSGDTHLVEVYTDDGAAPFTFNAADNEYIQQSSSENVDMPVMQDGAFADGFLRFNNQGRLANGEIAGSIFICNDDRTVGREIDVNLTGRVTVSELANPSANCP